MIYDSRDNMEPKQKSDRPDRTDQGGQIGGRRLADRAIYLWRWGRPCLCTSVHSSRHTPHTHVTH